MQSSGSLISPGLQRHPVKQQLPGEAGVEGESYRRWAGLVHTFYLSSCTGITVLKMHSSNFSFELILYATHLGVCPHRCT